MLSISQHIEPEIAGVFKQTLESVGLSVWVDRSKHNVNKTITGKAGQYHSAGKFALDPCFYSSLEFIAPKIDGLELQKIVVNKYAKGGHIPAHRDVEGYAAFAVLALEDGAGVFRYHLDNTVNDIEDKAGQLITCTSMNMLHELLPTPDVRFSIIFLYL